MEFLAGFMSAAVFALFVTMGVSETQVKNVKVGVCEQMHAEYNKSVGCVKDDRIIYRFKD